MIMWTNQPYAVYEQLRQTGIFRCDPKQANLLEYSEFLAAYQWMVAQMKKRISLPPAGVELPVWAWYRSRDFQHVRPDFRWSNDYDDQVCLEIDVPEAAVLLSDFQGWHAILNNFYYPAVTNETEWEQAMERYDQLSVRKQQRLKEQSWQRIFDITSRHGEWTSNGELVQGCFWQLEWRNVRRAWRLKWGEKVREMTVGKVNYVV